MAKCSMLIKAKAHVGKLKQLVHFFELRIECIKVCVLKLLCVDFSWEHSRVRAKLPQVVEGILVVSQIIVNFSKNALDLLIKYNVDCTQVLSWETYFEFFNAKKKF